MKKEKEGNHITEQIKKDALAIIRRKKTEYFYGLNRKNTFINLGFNTVVFHLLVMNLSCCSHPYLYLIQLDE